jgi:hypothetical protein
MMVIEKKDFKKNEYMKAKLLRYLTIMLIVVTAVSCEDDEATLGYHVRVV